MPALLSLILRSLITFGAGVGAASIVDKFVPDKLPAGTAPLYPNRNTAGQINWLRVSVFVVVGAIGIMILKWVGKKLRVKLLN